MQLREYQKEDVRFLLSNATRAVEHSGAVLGNEMRVGKTFPTILAAIEFLTSLEIPFRNCYIICPACAKYHWAREIAKVAGPTAVGGISIVESSKRQILITRDLPIRWIIMSYDVARALESIPAPDLLVFDEAQYLSSHDSKRVKALLGPKSFARKTPVTWFLSGTPFPDDIDNCYPVFNFCLGGALGTYYEFADTFCHKESTYHIRQFIDKNGKVVKNSKKFLKYIYSTATKSGKSWPFEVILPKDETGRIEKGTLQLAYSKYYGARDGAVAQLASLMKDKLRRVTLREAQPELPPIQEIVVPLKKTSKVEDILSILGNDEVDDVLVSIDTGKAPNLSGNLSIARRVLASEKVAPAVEFISDLLSHKKPIVVFAHHRNLIDGIVDGLSSFRVQSITGDTPKMLREDHIRHFQQGNIDCLVVSIKAAGVAIDLSRATINVIAEEDWSPGTMDQACARSESVQRTEVLTYYYLMFPDSIDEKAHNILMRKRRTISAFWDEHTKAVSARLDELF